MKDVTLADLQKEELLIQKAGAQISNLQNF